MEKIVMKMRSTFLGTLLLTAAFVLGHLTSYAQTVRYVVPNGTAAENAAAATSWATACADLQAVINASAEGDEVWVAAGTYKPVYKAAETDNTGASTTDRDRAFVMKKNVKLYGSFAGTETVLADRQLVQGNCTSILSGDFNSDDASFTGMDENAYHVIIVAGDAGTACIDGFAITGGNADGAEHIIVNGTGNNILRNSGGGIYIRYSSPVITGCTVSGNHASTQGGGIFIGGSTENILAPTLTSIAVTLNSVSGGTSSNGGGIANEYAATHITNALITGNSAAGTGATGNGGGISNTGTSAAVITNAVIALNSAARCGGGIYNYASAPIITNATVSGNTAGGSGMLGGGAMYNDARSNPTVRNSILYSNGADNNVKNGQYCSTGYLYCLVEGELAWGTSVILEGEDPEFENAVEGNFRLRETSPCLNMGSNTCFEAGQTPDLSTVTTDLQGNPRIVNELIDLGAYEYQASSTVSKVISGLVTLNSAPLEGVTISYGAGLSVQTNGEGKYAFTVDIDSTVTITPSKERHTFTPESILCENVTDDLTSQNFAAIYKPWEGEGTVEVPFLIKTVDDLALLASSISSTQHYDGNYFQLQNNLDLNVAPYNTGAGWLPVGADETRYFGGYFDGNGYAVQNMFINYENMSGGYGTYNCGLFGFIKNGGTVKNLGAQNINITVNVNDFMYIHAGGLIGRIQGAVTVADCYTTGKINVTGAGAYYFYVGGLAGYGYGQGTVQEITFQRCYSTCTVLGEGKTISPLTIGGLLGIIATGTLEDSYATGNVTGIVNINENYNELKAGGLMGSQNFGGTVRRCYATGSVSATGGADMMGNKTNNAGGIMGTTDAMSITSFLNRNVAVNSSISGVTAGRIIGNVLSAGNFEGELNFAWENMTVNGTAVQEDKPDTITKHGSNITEEQFHSEQFYTSQLEWDMSTVWNIWDTRSLPYLAWQSAPLAVERTFHTTIEGTYKNTPASIAIYRNGTLLTGTTSITAEGWSFTPATPFGDKDTLIIVNYEDGKAPSIPVTAVVDIEWDWDGEGTEDSPFLIKTVDDLAKLSANIKSANGINYSGQHFRLENSLDLNVAPWNTDAGWEPIGWTSVRFFGGHFDGNGHVIKNLYINLEDTNYYMQYFGGLFGALGGDGSIKNLGVENINININLTDYMYIHLGGLVGRIQGASVIQNCYTTGKITASQTGASYFFVGGLAGYALGKGNEHVVFSGCWSSCAVSGTGGGLEIGGLIGTIDTGTTENCYATGSVTGGSNAGGLLGNENFEAIIRHTYATGNVAATGNHAGGIIGYTGAAIVRTCWLSQNVAANGSISGTSAGRIYGGFLEDEKLERENNFALDSIPVNGQTVETDIAHNSMHGENATQQQLRSETFYTSQLEWDMNVWKIWDGKSMPYLAWQSAPLSVETAQPNTLEGTFLNQPDRIQLFSEDGLPVEGTSQITGDGWNFTPATPFTDGDRITILNYEDGKAPCPVTATISKPTNITSTLTGIAVYGNLNNVCIVNRNSTVLKSIQIIDPMGRIVYSGKSSSSVTIPVNGASGIYIVKLISVDNRTSTTKIPLKM